MLYFPFNFLLFSRGGYHLTEKSGWDVKSIMVSDLPVSRRNTTSVTVWIQKKGEFVLCESGTDQELRNWLMVSNIPFGSYQPEWKDYLKTYSSIFGWNWRLEVTPSIRNFRNFLSNGKHPQIPSRGPTIHVFLVERFVSLCVPFFLQKVCFLLPICCRALSVGRM